MRCYRSAARSVIFLTWTRANSKHLTVSASQIEALPHEVTGVYADLGHLGARTRQSQPGERVGDLALPPRRSHAVAGWR
jgi:hypothetical protein